MKKLYVLPFVLLLSFVVAGEAEAARYGTQSGGGNGQQNQYAEAGIAGDCIPNNTQDDDAVGDGTCTGDQDQLQLRDRDRDQSCDGDCDGDQQQDRDRDRDRIHQEETAETVANIKQLMERIRNAFHRLYGW